MKQKRYWLRGLIVGIIISIILLCVLIFFPVSCIGLSADGTSCVPPTGMDAIIYNLNTINDYLPQISFYFIFLPIFICFIIGLIYGKIKNRKKEVI